MANTKKYTYGFKILDFGKRPDSKLEIPILPVELGKQRGLEHVQDATFGWIVQLFCVFIIVIVVVFFRRLHFTSSSTRT